MAVRANDLRPAYAVCAADVAGRILKPAFLRRSAALTASVLKAGRARAATAEGQAGLYLEVRGKEGATFYVTDVVAASAWAVEVSGAVVGKVRRTGLTSVLIAADTVPAHTSNVDISAALETSDGCETSAGPASRTSSEGTVFVGPVAKAKA